MKKLLVSLLAVSFCLAAFAGCGDNNANGNSNPDSSSAPVEETTTDVEGAADYLDSWLIEKDVETRRDFTRPNSLVYPAIGGHTYTITWSVDVAEDIVKLVVDGDNTKVDVNEALDADTEFVLTATVSDGNGNEKTVDFYHTLLKAPSMIPLAITEKPAENTAYKLYVYQATKAIDCYFMGEMSGYYFKTSENYEEAVDLYVEYIADSDNFYVSFTHAEEGKQYIGVRLSDDGEHDNIVYTSEPVSEFYWNAELGTICTHLEKNKNGEAADYYLGNYSTHATFSASMLSYAANSNVGGLVTIVDKNSIVIPDDKKVSDVKEGLNVDTKHTLDKTVALTTSDDRYPEVNIVWTVEEGKGASVTAEGLQLVIPAEATTAVLTATISCGEVTETKEFTLELGPKTEAPDASNAEAIVNAAFNLAAGETLPGGNYTLTGVIVALDKYNNPTIVVGDMTDKEVLCYKLTDDRFAIGDTITVTGTLKNYKGTIEFDQGCTLDNYVAATPEEPETPDTPAGEVKTVLLTIDSMNLPVQTAYNTEAASVSVADIEFGYIQIGSYGNGLQWRTKNGLSGSLWNNTAVGKLTKIVLTHNADKKAYDGNAYTLALGNTADCADKTVDVGTSATGVTTIELTGEYTFFKLTHANTYTQYWDSIEISYAEVKQEAPTEAGSIALTIDNMGMPVQTAYNTDAASVTVADIEFGYIQIGSYGNGLQWRTKNGLSGSLWNNTALKGKITKIVLTHNADKKAYDGNAYTLALGNTADCADKTVDVGTSATGVTTIELTGEYTFFKLTHANTYTQYWDSIEIFYE